LWCDYWALIQCFCEPIDHPQIVGFVSSFIFGFWGWPC
jgi:hypothetical protein